MKLIQAHITKYKSIEDSTSIDIDKNVTVMVGVNEAGKSAFLESLHKARPVLGGAKYRDIFDYPRKDWNRYKRRTNQEEAATVAVLTYALDDAEVRRIETELGKGILQDKTFEVHHKYDNSTTVSLDVDENIIDRLLKEADITDELRESVRSAKAIHELVDLLKGQELAEKGTAFLAELENKYKIDNDTWRNTRLQNYVWRELIKPNIPEFLYFSDYSILPGKINIPSLRLAAQDPIQLNDGLKTALGLLEMANVTTEELENPESYEAIKAELEAISLEISNNVFQYWQQNKQLLVEFDVKEDHNEDPPFNSGANLYIRVKNLEHGVSVPFDQRSKGFVWFFSFIIWFNSVQNRIGTDEDLILLLDEPGLSLHGLAQADFLHYIEDLSKEHQILYTTHSPFMIDSKKLHQVRTVEDVKGKGTVISGSLSSTDKRTLFPLQAGLGYSLAQNLFIGTKNVLVEGPADLIFWKYFSALLEQDGRTGLDDSIVIVPTGGLDKIATFVSLLTGNELQMAVVHDYEGSADKRLTNLIQQKIIKDKQITNYAQFRDPTSLKPSDVEDMMGENLYLNVFNATYSTQLNGATITAKDLPKGDRMTERIGACLASKKINLRPTGGYNHYLVASHLAANPLPKKSIDKDTLSRFEEMFKVVNSLLK